MSTKNVALSSEVYERLAKYKKESESFSRTIDRLLSLAGSRHGGAEILRGLSELPSLTLDDASRMEEVVDQDRIAETWDRHDLR